MSILRKYNARHVNCSLSVLCFITMVHCGGESHSKPDLGQICNRFVFKYSFESKILFADKTLTVMDWPPQSPDLNIIEAVCDHQDRERNKEQPMSREELWELLKEA